LSAASCSALITFAALAVSSAVVPGALISNSSSPFLVAAYGLLSPLTLAASSY